MKLFLFLASQKYAATVTIQGIKKKFNAGLTILLHHLLLFTGHFTVSLFLIKVVQFVYLARNVFKVGNSSDEEAMVTH